MIAVFHWATLNPFLINSQMILTYMNDSEDIILSLILISRLELKSRPVKEENANMSQMISATSCFTASKQR